MKKQIFLIYCMLTGFSYMSPAQLAKLEQVRGWIIYDQSEDIPEDVLFIPASRIDSNDLKASLSTALKENSHRAMIMYFQGMRWRSPQLADELRKSLHIAGILTDSALYYKTVPVFIVPCTIVFNRVKPDNEFVRQETKAVLQAEDLDFDLILFDAPASVGFPLQFIKWE